MAKPNPNAFGSLTLCVFLVVCFSTTAAKKKRKDARTQRGRAATKTERGRSPSAAPSMRLRHRPFEPLTVSEAAANGDRPRSGTTGNLRGARRFFAIAVQRRRNLVSWQGKCGLDLV